LLSAFCLQIDAADNTPFAVVELFTPEGCSSCPKADAVLNQIVRQARSNKQPIYALAFHVDYWDKLNTPHGVWKDPYRSNAHTKYQKEYAHKNPITGRKGMLVTPQILVDGDHLPGGKLNFDTYFSKERDQQISQTVHKKDSTLIIIATCDNNNANSILCVALVERGISSKITKGENANKSLDHENVVRSFYRAPIKDSAQEISLSIPDDVNLKKCSVISYIQDATNMRTLAACRTDTRGISEARVIKEITKTQDKADIESTAAPKADCKDGQCVLPIEDAITDDD